MMQVSGVKYFMQCGPDPISFLSPSLFRFSINKTIALSLKTSLYKICPFHTHYKITTGLWPVSQTLSQTHHLIGISRTVLSVQKLLSPKAWARPKSDIFTRSDAATSMFRAARSLCTMLRLPRYSMPSAISNAYFISSDNFK